MTNNVVIGKFITTLDVPVERIIKGAIDADLQDITIVGYDKEGNFYFASNKADGGFQLWLFETAKLELFKVVSE